MEQATGPSAGDQNGWAPPLPPQQPPESSAPPLPAGPPPVVAEQHIAYQQQYGAPGPYGAANAFHYAENSYAGYQQPSYPGAVGEAPFHQQPYQQPYHVPAQYPVQQAYGGQAYQQHGGWGYIDPYGQPMYGQQHANGAQHMPWQYQEQQYQQVAQPAWPITLQPPQQPGYRPAPMPQQQAVLHAPQQQHPPPHNAAGSCAAAFGTTAEPAPLPPSAVNVLSILDPPGRARRPKRLAVILRGLPGSGKSHVARLLRDAEIARGGEAPRIFTIDDYFMTVWSCRINQKLDEHRFSLQTEFKQEPGCWHGVKSALYEFGARMRTGDREGG